LIYYQLILHCHRKGDIFYPNLRILIFLGKEILMNCKRIVVVGLCVLVAIAFSWGSSGVCQQTKESEVKKETTGPQATPPAGAQIKTPAAPSDDKAKTQPDASAKESAPKPWQTDETKTPGRFNPSEGC
jgi:hypothetical protein